MTEEQPETHQDPAEPKQVDTEVETDNQPEPEVHDASGGVVVAPEDPAVREDTQDS